MYFKFPVIEEIKTMDVRILKEEKETVAASKDLQSVDVTAALNFNISPDKVSDIYRSI